MKNVVIIDVSAWTASGVFYGLGCKRGRAALEW
jgi:hypothetical protein